MHDSLSWWQRQHPPHYLRNGHMNEEGGLGWLNLSARWGVVELRIRWARVRKVTNTRVLCSAADGEGVRLGIPFRLKIDY